MARWTASFTPASARAYGQFLGQRYRERRNLIWILGGDKAPSTPEALAIWRALAAGIAVGVAGKEDYAACLMTYHTSGPGNASDYVHDEPWLSFTSIQSSHGDRIFNWPMIEKNYRRQPAKPVIDLESSYPDALILPEWLPASLRAGATSRAPANDDHARRAAYWSVFSGAAGHTYGHNSIWQMHAPGRKGVLNAKSFWYDALAAPSAAQMGYLRRLIESRPFLTGAPDQALLAGPPGEDVDHIAALRGDGYALIYTPTGKPFTVDLSRLTGPQVEARWFDPRTGKDAPIGAVPIQGQREFTPPGPPAVGNDWVLTLDAPAAPGR